MTFEPRELLRPLNLAAMLVWVTVAHGLLTGQAEPRGALDRETVFALSLLLHALFLAVFLIPQTLPRALRLRSIAPWCGLLLALALIGLRTITSTPVLLIVVMGMLATRLSAWQLVATWVLTNVSLYVLIASGTETSSPLTFTVLFASFQLFAMVTAGYAHSAEQSRDALALLNAELLATRSLLTESARDQERLRLSRELHDVAGHKLTALKLNLAAASRDPDLAASAEVALSARLADELLGDIRGVVAQMRAHDGMNLRAAIEQLAAPLPRPRVHIDVAADATVATVEQAEAVVRAVQEALTNAARHSAAENVWIALRREGAQLRIEVRDDGRGSATVRFGNGLTGMRERLEALGGGLTVDRARDGGVALHGWLRLA